LGDVVTAAGKRLGEALRVIEECLKIEAPEMATRAESARYRFYDMEMRLARTLCAAERFAHVRLYVLITESSCKRPWREVAQAAIAGGGDCLQLREKNLEGGELLARARELVQMCRKAGVLCIINDRPDVAILADADGVHVGQGDLPAVEARKLIGREKLLGVSTHSIKQARQAAADGADYIGVGPVFLSPTKPRDFVPGLALAKEAAEISIPAVAIAGISEANLDDVLATGVSAVAVTAAIAGADDPEAATRRIKGRLTAREKVGSHG
jgi:thiamine-phosphate pyrophosphorylase